MLFVTDRQQNATSRLPAARIRGANYDFFALLRTQIAYHILPFRTRQAGRQFRKIWRLACLKRADGY